MQGGIIARRVAAAPALGAHVADGRAGYAAREHVAGHVGHHATGERGRVLSRGLSPFAPRTAAGTAPPPPATAPPATATPAAATPAGRPAESENGHLHTGHGSAADNHLRPAESRRFATARHHYPAGRQQRIGRVRAGPRPGRTSVPGSAGHHGAGHAGAGRRHGTHNPQVSF